MNISARNRLKGKVVHVKKGAVAAQVEVDIGGGNRVTSTITVTSVEELGIEVGKEVYAVIKASDVMIGVEH